MIKKIVSVVQTRVLTITVPKKIANILQIKRGDQLEMICDPENETVTFKKVKDDIDL